MPRNEWELKNRDFLQTTHSRPSGKNRREREWRDENLSDLARAHDFNLIW